MFGSDSVVGEITDPQGSLKIGCVGDTECVYFQYQSSQGDRTFSQVYTARELSGLIATAKKAQAMAPTLKPRSTIRLGTQTPKPIRLQIVLVAPENKSPLVILRFNDGDWKQDVFSAPDSLVELLQKAERRAPLPGVTGILDRFGDSIWMIEGQTLEVREELSHGTGYYREYVHHSEVPEGTVVRAWPITLEGKMVVVAFEYAQSWEPGAKPDLPQGQKGDQALADGQVRQSRELHAVLSKTMYESGRVDPVWSGKVALSSIIGDIAMSDEKTGRSAWSGEGGNPVLKAGVEAIRDGKLSPHDSAIFAMITAYYEGAQTEPATACTQIDESMSQAWNYALFNAPEMRRLVLANWYLLLQRANKGAGAGPAFQKWQEARESLESQVKPTVFCLPSPYPWTKTWKPAKTSQSKPEPEPTPEPEPAPKISAKTPLPDLPEVSSRPVDHALPPQEAEEPEEVAEPEAAPWSDELMSLEDGTPRGSKKGSPFAKIIVGLLVLGLPAAYALSQGLIPGAGPPATPSPTPSATVAPTQTPTAVKTPVPAVTPKTTPTPDKPVAGPLPEGDLLVNGFSLANKLKEQDIFAAGYEPVDRFAEGDEGIARYRGPKGEVIVNFKLPSRIVTAIQGDHLEIDGQMVADLSSDPSSFENDDRFSKYKIEAVVDDEGKVRAYTLANENIYLPEPLVGSPPKAVEYSRKIRNKKFFETLPEGVANMRMSNGEPILFQFLGSFDIDRMQYLIEQGADPNAKAWSDGGTALHHCQNVKSAKMLLKLGANPNAINKMAQTPYESATNPELKEVLDPNKAEATPTPSPTPETSATPAATATPSPTPK